MKEAAIVPRSISYAYTKDPLCVFRQSCFGEALHWKEAEMKRHFSNRGEALSEVTAARVLASRKTAVRASFMTQAERRTNPLFWSLQRVEVGNRPRKSQLKGNNHGTILL
jgi:hypothetical protein